MNHGQDRCFSNLLMQQAANPGVGTASRSRLSMRLGPRFSRESQAALIRPHPSPPLKSWGQASRGSLNPAIYNC